MGKANKKRKKLSVVNLLFGIIFFCGAIYLLVNGFQIILKESSKATG